ncbi:MULTISPECIES: histidine kinase [Leptolyngbya]|jgi:two-component system clock-associated histidine kinase SasA|uniref:Adaptive-response sensory-kinase SasA n=3 Tax=Leptolyngbya TaxID=47251 RepID=A0A1Z4JID4_LEPBY|nr:MULTISPECIES: histidine kinase [Leptolyngbya]WNZ44613.1 histidine kinase [Leptolyngbya boryana CZ1]BAS57319.1 histidine kinase [Leptolyngbya boryana IAM M-101]BAS63667.1 histidine kinase [Leptolyngbya boryana dg5]BAY56490.1 adaptive-response sensory kinase [Leptolyngbya boryana NIES-2135]
MTMQAHSNPATDPKVTLQILLFVDQRPASREQIRQIRGFLKDRSAECPFELEVVDVGEQPYLAEHFRLIATPALIKLHPEPRQTLTGSDLIVQLKNWWSRWQKSIEETLPSDSTEPSASVGYSAELIKLTDEVFRLQRENENLQAQLQFKDQIISMLAHDLRNPLTAASIAIETLEIAYKQADGQTSRLTPQMTANLLKHGRTQIRTIDRMITDILQAARGTSSELHIQPEKIDLRALCEDVLAGLGDRMQSKNQQIATDMPSDLPIVYADGERIRQVLVNILDNAIKYTPTGGKIQVSILHRTAQKVQVSICDTGPGVPPENRDRVFEDHYRLQRDEAQDGYGIGLSLCQRIVRAHYGQIWVDSIANQGSCFHFTLPIFRS